MIPFTMSGKITPNQLNAWFQKRKVKRELQVLYGVAYGQFISVIGGGFAF